MTEKSRNESPELVTVDPPDTKDDVEPAHVGKAMAIEDVAFVTQVVCISFGCMH